MFRQDVLQKWRKVSRLNYSKTTVIGATVRFQRSQKSLKTTKPSGSQKGKEHGREPDSPGTQNPSPGLELGCRPDQPRTRRERFDRLSGYSTGSEDSCDSLPLLLGEESIDDLDFGNAALCFNMPFGFLKKKKQAKVDQEADESQVFLRDPGPQKALTTYGTQPLDPGHENGDEESAIALIAKDEDDHHSLNDSGVESQAGESSKETSPEPEEPSEPASLGSRETPPDGQENPDDEQVLFESFTTLRDNPSLRLEGEPPEQIPLVEDLISVNMEDEEDKEDEAGKPGVEEEAEVGKVEIAFDVESGAKESEGSPLIDKDRKKKRHKLLCCTIM